MTRSIPFAASFLLSLACTWSPEEAQQQDCDGASCDQPDPEPKPEPKPNPQLIDADGDGYFTKAMFGQPADCDDGDPDVNPGAEEVCDGVDNDCSGSIDQDAVDADVEHYADKDGDGAGERGTAAISCAVPEGRAPDASDCDDDDASTYGGAPEVCDGFDNDCDGALRADEGDQDADATPDCADRDRDGDGLSNEDEQSGAVTGVATDPDNPDSDGDGTRDGADDLPLDAACAILQIGTDFSSLHEDWAVVAGVWQIDSDAPDGLLKTSPTAAGEAIYYDDTEYSNEVIEATLSVGSTRGDAGVLFRLQDPGTARNNSQKGYYLGVYVGSQKLVFGKMDGRWNVLQGASITAALDEELTLRIESEGPYFDVYADGELVMQVEDDTYADGTVGLRTYLAPMAVSSLTVCN